MFIEKTIKGKRIYCSDILVIEHFFNSRDFMVKENLPLVANYFNLKPENIIKPTQTHSKNSTTQEINPHFIILLKQLFFFFSLFLLKNIVSSLKYCFTSLPPSLALYAAQYPLDHRLPLVQHR